MSKKNGRRVPLVIKYGLMSVVALFISFFTHYLIYDVATEWYLNSEKLSTYWWKKGNTYLDGFQAYILENNLTCNQALLDVTWKHENYTMTVYVEPDYSSEPEGLYYPIGQGPTDYGLRPLKCKDGVVYALSYPSELYYYSRARAIGLIVGAVCFLFVSVPFILHSINKISRLQRAVGVLASGTLTQPIGLYGHDEIGELGYSIDKMRCSLLSSLENERALTDSSQRLITSLSHDLRTPLTKLLGYLELLQSDKLAEIKPDDIVFKAVEKAKQLRTLTNELFMQASSSGSSEGLQFELLSGTDLFNQIFEEACFELDRKGYRVTTSHITSPFYVSVRVMDILRVFDNIFSNIAKYGDKNSCVEIKISESAKHIAITILNEIGCQEVPPESHQIGIPTMKSLLVCNGGTIEISINRNTYRTIIRIPKAEKKN